MKRASKESPVTPRKTSVLTKGKSRKKNFMLETGSFYIIVQLLSGGRTTWIPRQAPTKLMELTIAGIYFTLSSQANAICPACSTSGLSSREVPMLFVWVSGIQVARNSTSRSRTCVSIRLWDSCESLFTAPCSKSGRKVVASTQSTSKKCNVKATY